MFCHSSQCDEAQMIFYSNLTGWGKTSKSVGMHDVLQEASMPVVDSKVCYEKNKEVIPIPVSLEIELLFYSN